MKRKSNVTILGQDVSVTYEKITSETEILHGDYLDQAIRINSDSKHDARRILLHECMHAILEVSGQSCLLKTKREEAIVLCLENGLWPLIKKGIFNEKK